MPTIEESVTISAPVEKVFAIIADARNAVLYDASVVRCEPEDDAEPAVGTRWRGAAKVLGREFDWVLECTEFETDQAITLKAVEGRLPFEVRNVFSPEGDGTRLDYRLDADSGLGGLFGKIADPLVTRAQTRTVRTNLATFKELLENDAI